MDKIIVIAGPTASGKTAVAVALAKLIGGEVVSADSMQIYKGMDIGTAKPTLEEQQGIPHHMIDIVKPDEPFSAALYQQQARAVIAGILACGHVPILCGGTGFYINGVLYDVNFAADEDSTGLTDMALREHYTSLAAEHGSGKLHSILLEADPEAAMAIHPNNYKRVIRALGYIQATGQLFSRYNRLQRERPPVYDAVFCRLEVNRPELYQRINNRTQAMFDAGLADEVAGLMAQGYDRNLVSMQGIGYKEVIPLVLGEYTLPEAINAVQQNSRNYAKRQQTWFRNQNPDALVADANGRTPGDIAQEINNWYNGRYNHT